MQRTVQYPWIFCVIDVLEHNPLLPFLAEGAWIAIPEVELVRFKSGLSCTNASMSHGIIAYR